MQLKEDGLQRTEKKKIKRGVTEWRKNDPGNEIAAELKSP